MDNKLSGNEQAQVTLSLNLRQTRVVQGFLDSHSIDNYGWIFNLKTIDKGYVTPRE